MTTARRVVRPGPANAGDFGEVVYLGDIASGGLLPVKDDWGSTEILADQSGAGAVLTFTFANGPVNFIWVTDTGTTSTNISRCDPTGGTPSASTGIPVLNQTPTPISVAPASSTIKVFAPSGSTINVYGYRR